MDSKPANLQGLTTTGILFYNAVLSMPALAVALTISREPWHLLQFPDLHSRGFRVFLRFAPSLREEYIKRTYQSVRILPFEPPPPPPPHTHKNTPGVKILHQFFETPQPRLQGIVPPHTLLQNPKP